MSGLWSVKMVKTRPSRMNRKCLMPEKQAHSSQSKVLHFTWEVDNFLEKKPKGHQFSLPGICCCRTAPTWDAEAGLSEQQDLDVGATWPWRGLPLLPEKHVTSLVTRTALSSAAILHIGSRSAGEGSRQH